MTTVGAAGTSVFADLTNQEGVGHNSYYPDYQGGAGDDAARANREANATDDQPPDPEPAPTGAGERRPPVRSAVRRPTTAQPPAGRVRRSPPAAGTGGAAGGGAGAEAAEVAVVAL